MLDHTISAPTENGEPMAEYIEREAAIESIMREPTEAHYPYWYADRIKNIQTADVAPVVHGRWEHNSDFQDRFICYGCGAMFDMWKHEQRLFNYCPNCGAKMDGGDEDVS